jgi:hypothetical protein
MSVWATPATDTPDDWCAALAAFPIQSDLPASARWYEHPRISRYAHRRFGAAPWTPAAPTPTAAPPAPTRNKRRQKRQICYPRLRRQPSDENSPLPWNLAQIIVKASSLGHYHGAFPVTIGEFKRIQAYREADSRGREPLRREVLWIDSKQWKHPWKDQATFEDVKDMVCSWGYNRAMMPVLNRDLELMLERKARAHEFAMESKREDLDGYIGGSEDEGGFEDGRYPWKHKESYVFKRRSTQQKRRKDPWPFEDEYPDCRVRHYHSTDEECNKSEGSKIEPGLCKECEESDNDTHLGTGSPIGPSVPSHTMSASLTRFLMDIGNQQQGDYEVEKPQIEEKEFVGVAAYSR